MAIMSTIMGRSELFSYHPMAYGDKLPEFKPNAAVLLVDYSRPRAELSALAEAGHSVVVLDHHKTAAEDLAGLLDPGDPSTESPNLRARFNTQKSGAMLAWEYARGFTEPPEMITLIQDRDLWTWNYGDRTKQFAAFLQTLPCHPDVYLGLMLTRKMDDMCREGASLLAMQDQYIKRLAKNAHWFYIDGIRAVACCAPVLQSELGEYLLAQYPDSPFVGLFYTPAVGEVRWSLRSRGDFDCAELAAKFNGGGHKAAAGFTYKEKAVPCPVA
jgi:nanoRNase/pAp phosphatase (c-di-AMP/oligoRNAs hydrolase)